jgi:putative aldouronate transport system permease protein
MADERIEETRIPRTPSPRLRNAASRLFDAANGLFLVLFSATAFYPFWSTLLLSFSDPATASSLGLHLWIGGWTTAAYEFAFSTYSTVKIAYVNSIFRTVIGTALTMAVTLLGAYPLSKRRLPGRTAMTLFLLVTMFVSGGLIPSYLLVRSLGLIDSRWSLILPGLASGYYIIIVRNFLMTIDPAFEESGFIDGADYLQILARIIVPLCKPVIATVALWCSVGHWNAWFDALIYINSESKIVLQLLLRRLIQQMTLLAEQINNFELIERKPLPTEAVKAAITILTIGPIILLYPFLQRHFVKGIFVGSLKG